MNSLLRKVVLRFMNNKHITVEFRRCQVPKWPRELGSKQSMPPERIYLDIRLKIISGAHHPFAGTSVSYSGAKMSAACQSACSLLRLKEVFKLLISQDINFLN
ncbi:MAG: hypothetical protein GY857_01945 [Desulfobacula sp.]|nr:hypothetical protein [Desulfobacula sp.]